MLQPNQDKKDYTSNVYNALKDNLTGFNKTEQEFRNEIQNPEYAKKVHKALSDNLSGFTKTEDEFIGLVSKKKDLSQPIQNSDSTSKDGSLDLPKFNVSDYASKKPSVKKEVNQIQKDNTSTEPNRRDISIEQVAKDNKIAEPFVKKQKQLINEKLSDFRDATAITDADVEQAKQEVNDQVQTKGFLNNVKAGLKYWWNNTFNEGGPQFETDALADVKPDAKKSLLDSGFKPDEITPDLLQKTAIDIKTNRLVEDKKLSLVNDYLDNLPSEDKDLLELNAYDKIKKTKPIVEKQFKEIKAFDIQIIQDNERLKTLEQKFKTDGFTEQEANEYKSLSTSVQEKIKSRTDKYKKFSEDYSNLGTTEEEYDLFKRNYGFTDKAGKLLNAFADFGLGVVQFGNLAQGGPMADFRSMQIAEIKASKDKAVSENFQKQPEDIHSINDFIDYSADTMITQAPQLALGYATGGTSMIAGIGISSAGNQYSKLTQSNLEGKTDYSKGQIIASSLITGGAEMIEANTLKMITGGKRLLTSVINNEPTRELFKKSLTEKTLSFGKELLKNYAGEVKEELTTYGVEKLSDIAILDMKSEDVFKNAPQDIKQILGDTAIMTVGLHAFPIAVGKITKVFTPKSYTTILDANNRKISEAQKIIDNSEISQEVKNEAQKILQNSVKSNETALKEIIKNTSELKEPFVDKVIELEQKSSDIRNNAQKIYEDLSLKKEQRQMMLSELESEYNSNETLREKIVSGKSTILDIIPKQESDALKKKAVDQLISEKEGTNEANYTTDVINQKAVEIYNQENNNQAKEAKDNSSLEIKNNEIPNTNQINNETISGGNTTIDGNIQPRTSVVEENRVTESKSSPTENISEPTNIGASQENIKTEEVKYSGFGNKESVALVEKNQDGEIISIKNPKDGKIIDKFVERKAKDGKTYLAKNANYAKIEAVALGIQTDNALKVEKENQFNKILDDFTATNEYEAALEAFARGSKVSKESLKNELGNKDASWATNQFSKKPLPSIEVLSEKIHEDYPQLDQMEIRNAIIDVISSHASLDEIKQNMVSFYNENSLKKDEAEMYAYLGTLSEKDLAMFQELKAEEGYLKDLSDKEAEDYFKQKYDEYEQGRIATQTIESGGRNIAQSNEGTTREGEQDRTQKGNSDNGGQRINLSKDLKLDELKSWLDQAEKDIDKFGQEHLSMGIPLVVAKTALKAMRLATQTASSVADIISAGLNAVKESEWYQNLSKKEQEDIDSNFVDYINKPFVGSEQKKSRFKIEEEVAKNLSDGITENDILDSYSERREKMIAKDYIERQKNISESDAKKKVDDSFKKADNALVVSKSVTEKIDSNFRKTITNLFDRQFVPKFILNKAGGKLIRNYLIASKGATGYAKEMYDEAYSKIYKGLTTKEIKTLDKVIQLRRFIAIDQYRAKNDMPLVVHQDYINSQVSQSYLSALEKEIGKEKYDDLIKRADNYFDSFRGLLSDMQKSGLISKESRDRFFEVDYQPRMFMEFLKDNEDNFSLDMPNNSGLSSEQIKKLEDGLDTSLINDSQYLLSRSMNTRAKSIAMNNTNKKLSEFIEKQKQVVDELRNKENLSKKEKDTIKYFDELQKRVRLNPIFGFTETGNPKHKNKTPDGFKNTYYYIDGVKHNIQMEEKFHEAYFDSARGIFKNNGIKETVAMASGTGLVKSIATGNNPTFFITNTPRDFMFLATFSEEYGMSVLQNMAKITKDVTLGIRDIRKENDNFKNYVKYGGMMDFLKDQGKLKPNTGVKKLFDKIDNKTKERASNIFNIATLSKLQTYSEIGFRMAVFNRSVKNQLSELGLKSIDEVTDKNQVDDIYTNAVASARGNMDFNQGGIYTKDIDAFIPYLNASTQGVRVMVDNLRTRPVETTFRIAQTSAILSSAAIGLSIALFSAFKDDDDEQSAFEKYLDAERGVSKYEKTNYFRIYTGKKTDSGEYEYFRIAKSQELTPFLAMSEGIIKQYMKIKTGDDTKTDAIDNVKFALGKNVSPIEFSITGNVSRIPIFKSALSYSLGYDFYRDEDLSHLKGKVPVAAEGYESKSVEDFYKKMGEQSGYSPVRMKAAVESYITTPSTSPYVGFLYGGLDAMASDKYGKEVLNKLGKDLLKSTLNRIKKETSDFNRRLQGNEELQKKIEEVEIENVKTKSKFKSLADGYDEGSVTKQEISQELQNIAKENPIEAKRLSKIISDRISNKNVSPYVFEIKYAKSAGSRALMLVDLFGDDLKHLDRLSSEEKNLLRQLQSQKAINKETLLEYSKLVSE